MPTLQVTVSTATYTTLNEAARLRDLPLEAVVEEALNAFLQVSDALPTNGGADDTSNRAWRRAKIQSEARTWRALPETVRRSYGSDFVAVHDGQVIDRDADRLTLYRRVRARLGNVPVLITPADQPSPRVFQIHSPRLERFP